MSHARKQAPSFHSSISHFEHRRDDIRKSWKVHEDFIKGYFENPRLDCSRGGNEYFW